MQSATEHCQNVLAAIIPNRRDLLDVALQHLTPDHFQNQEQHNIYVMLERYANVTSCVLTKQAMGDILRGSGADPSKIMMYEELYDLLQETQVSDGEFTWSVEQVRELAAERATAEAITEAMEILQKGIKAGRGQEYKGHSDARNHLLQKFAEIDRDLSMQEAPEGDIRLETDKMLEDYAARKKARGEGKAKGLLFGVPELDVRLGGINNGELTLVTAGTSVGKSLSVDSLVLTPDRGFVRMGDIQPGDSVVDPEGSPSVVTGVFPQGVIPTYRVTFSDGSSVEASEDHLWSVEVWEKHQEKRTQKGIPGRHVSSRVRKVLTTRDLIEMNDSYKRNPRLVSTSDLSKLDFEEGTLPIDPYLLGLLLGDGSFTDGNSVTFASVDKELIDLCRDKLPVGVDLVLQDGDENHIDTYRLSGHFDQGLCKKCKERPHRSRGLCHRCHAYESSKGNLESWTVENKGSIMRSKLSSLGLYGRSSVDKFVPESYKYASADSRLSILQGLLDTDGWYHNSSACFSSASKQLRDDVVWLARSLGLWASSSDKATNYTYKGERREGKRAYQARIHATENISVFRLKRKMDNPIARASRIESRVLKSVEYVGDKECQCISVSAPSKLYVTDDFIPTHNTTLCVQLGWHTAVMQGLNVVYFTSETIRPTVARKLVCRHSKLDIFGLPDGINTRDVRDAVLPEHLEDKFQEILRDFRTNPNYGSFNVVQMPRGSTMSSLESRLYRISRSTKISLVIIDSLQLMRSERKRDSDREELGMILKDAKQLSVVFDEGRGVPVISPWQVNRTNHKLALAAGYYSLDSLADTHEASTSPDVIVSLLEPSDSESRYVELRCQILKNRDGERASSLSVDTDYATCWFGSKERSDSMDGLIGDDGLF